MVIVITFQSIISSWPIMQRGDDLIISSRGEDPSMWYHWEGPENYTHRLTQALWVILARQNRSDICAHSHKYSTNGFFSLYWLSRDSVRIKA